MYEGLPAGRREFGYVRRSRPRPRSCVLGYILLLQASVHTSAVSAQIGPDPPPLDSPRSATEVYLMVFGPGDDLLGRYGHAAIWVRDPEHGTDIAYNYGISQATAGGAEQRRRLFRHEILVRPVARDANEMIDTYGSKDRSVEILRLNLSPEQTAALMDSLQADLAPGRPALRQDFYRRNCTTGVRDAIDRALGGQLKAATANIRSPHTFRFHSLRYMSDSPVLYAGLLLALGDEVDRPITAWEEMFTPALLAEELRGVTVVDEFGRKAPLVESSETLYRSSRPATPPKPPVTWPLLLLCGTVLGAAMAGLGGGPRRRVARFGFMVMAGLWSGFAGSIGIVLASFWILTEQYRNCLACGSVASSGPESIVESAHAGGEVAPSGVRESTRVGERENGIAE